MSIWSTKQKKSEPLKRTTIKYENDKIVIQTYLSKDESVAIREKLRSDYRNIPKLNKNTFEQCWNNYVEGPLDEYIESSVQQLADESDKPSTFESW